MKKPPLAAQKEGTRGEDMKRCMKSSCLVLVMRGPRDRPRRDGGSNGTGLAVPSIVTGDSMSSCHRPPASVAHLISLAMRSPSLAKDLVMFSGREGKTVRCGLGIWNWIWIDQIMDFSSSLKSREVIGLGLSDDV
jgi:hypothetical protein